MESPDQHSGEHRRQRGRDEPSGSDHLPAVDPETPDLLKKVQSPEKQEGKAQEQQTIRVPATKSGGNAGLADVASVDIGGAEVIKPEGGKHQQRPEGARDRGAVARGAQHESDRILDQPAKVDRDRDSGGGQDDVQVEPTNRRGALIGIAVGKSLRDPPVDSPYR